MPKKDSADRLADEILEWVERMSDAVAEDILGSDLRPKTAQTTEAERLDYFRTQFFLSDGTPNAVGQEAVIERYGLDEYEKIAKALATPGEVRSAPAD